MVKPVGGSPSPQVQNVSEPEPQSSAAASQPAESSPEPQASSVPSNPGRQIAEHSIAGQALAGQLHREIQGRVTQQAPAQPQPGSSQAAQTRSMQSVLQDAGMRRVSDPPTEAQLRQYHTQHGPAHAEIARGDYAGAAAQYRQLAQSATDPAERTRLQSTAGQLDVMQTMRNAGVRNLQFPPTEQNFQAYFRTMRGRPASEIQSAFQQYTDAFYVHSETRGVDRGDILYDRERHVIGNTAWNTDTPEDWNDVNNSRELHTDGRRIIDCEGYALLGQRALSAAGFSHGQFAATYRNDDPNTPQNESLSQHMMFTAQRTITDSEGHRRTEMAVISNDRMYTGQTGESPSQSDIDNEQGNVLARAYRQTFGGVRHGSGVTFPGGIIVLGDSQWRAEVDLDQQMTQRQQQH